MKNYITLILVLLFVGLARADDGYHYNFKSVPVSEVLPIYSKLVGKELIIEAGVTNQWKAINLQTDKGLSKDEAIKLLESALRDQAGVAIKSLDDKRVSVTLVKK
jgi:type II secretory pathway component GspD/PulD (secretin)